MSGDKFQIAGGELSGRGLTFSDVDTLVPVEQQDRLVEICEVIYRQGREAVRLSADDRFDLRDAVESLRALDVIAGFPGNARHRRAADAIERLLHEQDREP